MDKKFEEMEGRIKSVENKFENKFVDIENKFENKFEDMESKLEAKIFEKVEAVSISFRSDLEKLKQKVMTGQGDEFKFQAPYSKPSIKLSTYDGKSSWQVYKTQFSIVADANQWDSQTKACQLAASLRADAADILQTLPETQRLDFDALVNALELRFGEKCVKDYSRLQLKSRQQKVSETLQELATDVERLSHLAFSDCPTEVREVLALQHFIDGVRDLEIQKALRMADLKDLKRALVFAMKLEAAQQATRKDRHPIRAVNESDTSNSSVERLERQMRSFMNRVESLMSQKADGKKTLKCWTCGREGHLQRSCRARQGAETNSASRKEVSEKLINGHLVGRRLPDFGKPHFQVCQISTKSNDIADPFILGLDFLKEHGFTLDFNKNELRSIHEEVTIFKIEHGTESIRQVTANENITIPPRTEIIVPGYIGNDVSFNSGLIGSAENKANGLLIASTLVDLSRKTIPVRICNVTEKPRVFQKGEVLATCSPVTCVCKSSSLLLSNSPQQLTPDLLENADALSRRPCPENCRHCSRVETKYDYAIRQITTSTATPPDPWSDEKVREDQMADPDIKPLIEFMESSSNKPSWQDISAYSPTTKQYWALWNSLHLRNGVLYRKFESEDGKTFRWQLVLPRSRIPEVLKELHGSPTGGHFGVMKTLHRVRERFFWGKVRADVEQWCKSCDACSARKGPKIRSRGKLHRYNVGAPFERIAFDILGPLPRTASGNKYLLVVIDYFTKWPEVYPIPDQEAPTVAEAVVQHWISRYGVPLQLHSDQGRNFVSAVLKGVCELLGIDKTKTTPLHPQSDGMVERFNRTILNNLSLMVSKNQQDWDQKVPLFLLAYRSAVHETTGYSPSQMLFGRDLRLPCDLLFGRPPDTPSSPEEYVQNLQARFEDVHNLARERINLRTEKMKTRYDTKATGHQFKEGDKVWFYNPTRRKGLSPKLQSHWDGPYTILKIINDVVIRIRKSTNSKPRVVHYDRLAPYYGHNS
ncbi:retrovirus-related Pol polyprotein from transposon 412 [Trichonephila clavipes]|nr:retrovirus-related Pol polyprotein from transposon 412 [Trichonephila clavipes]